MTKQEEQSVAGTNSTESPTNSTESPANSAESISKVNANNDDQEPDWVKNGLNRSGKDKGYTKSSTSPKNRITLSNIGGIASIPNQSFLNEEILVAPSTIEERQNEKYARKVGINFSIDKGDYFTLFSGISDDDHSASIESDISSSPQYGKKDKELTFRSLYGDVSQILDFDQKKDNHMELTTPRAQPDQELITPRTRTAMIDHDQIAETLRPIAVTLSVDWGKKEYMAPTLARRLRDFEFAQKKRRRTIGISRKWGMLALYDFLAAVREDVEWVEDAAWRRANCLPYVRWLDYIQNKRRITNKPIFVYSLLIACVVTLVTSIGINDWSFESFSLNPSFGPSAETLIIMGAKHSSLIVNNYQIWRLFTPMFLHGGVVHFLLNCFALSYIGRAVEQSHGTLFTAILFIVPSVGSVIISSIFLPQYISVGASGGIFGLIGACIADVMKNRRLLFSDFINKGRSKRYHAMVIMILVLDIIVNLMLGLTPFTDNFMHCFGFIFGMACASTMLNVVNLFGHYQHKESTLMSHRCSIIFRYFGLIVSLVVMIVATIFLFNGDGTTSPCKFCGVISCVSFPPWVDSDSRWWYCDNCGEVSGVGKIDEATGEYFAIDLKCPNGETIDFYLDDDIDKSHESLEANLPMFCREKCLN